MDAWVSRDKKKEADASKGQSENPMGSACQECNEKKLAKIVKIDWVDDTDGTNNAKRLLGRKSTQFVNLPREDKFVDGAIVKNKDRLTNKPRFRVEFDQPGNHAFKVKLIPGGSNAAYTETEKTRNSKFTYDASERSYTTDADGTKIVDDDMHLTVAGNDSYKLQAADEHANKVASSEIVTRRLMYYVNVKMTGLRSVADNTNGFRNEFQKHFIQFEELPSVSMEHIPNVGTDTGPLVTAARGTYETSKGPEKEGHVIAVLYTDHLAVKNAGQGVIKSDVAVGAGKPAVVVPIVGRGITNPAVRARSLWKDLVPGESWFVSATYRPDDGDNVAIPQAKCSALPADSSNCRSVSVDVTGLPAGRGTITLVVNWVDRMRGGLSLGGGNAVCICTRAWWRDINTAEQNQVLVHEVGHQVGMVANGTGILPDKVSTHYDSGKGHVGDHCHHGIAAGQARYDGAADGAAARCVMYGATNAYIAFCANCASTVRKLDVTNAIPRF